MTEGYPFDSTSERAIIENLKQTEKDVSKELRAHWKKWGFFYIRNQQGLGSKRGTADYTVIKGGRTAFVEAKATMGKQSPFQIEFQKEVEAAGGEYILAHSVTEFAVMWSYGKKTPTE
jgi:hypothetical protein